MKRQSRRHARWRSSSASSSAPLFEFEAHFNCAAHAAAAAVIMKENKELKASEVNEIKVEQIKRGDKGQFKSSRQLAAERERGGR